MTSPAMVAGRSVVQPILRFTAVQGGVVALLAFAMTRWVWTDANAQHAVVISAWLAFVVQIFTFSICKLVARENVMAGWGLGSLLRFATLGAWGLVGTRALGLDVNPALVSLATFFFVSTVIEPLFLNN